QESDAGKELLDTLEILYLNPVGSDLIIFCGEERHLVHQNLVCTRSAFFADACSWGDNAQHVQREVILGEDPAIVKQIVRYFYYDDYAVDPTWEHSQLEILVLTEPRCRALLFHMHIYALASKLQIEGLKELSMDRAKLELSRDLSHLMLVFSISGAYSLTDAGSQELRDMVVGVAIKQLHLLLELHNRRE
ncbi:uncharacterized protein BO97DRAFT_343358, partial [Aspergillus homomorphus CBS 101889]